MIYGSPKHLTTWIIFHGTVPFTPALAEASGLKSFKQTPKALPQSDDSESSDDGKGPRGDGPRDAVGPAEDFGTVSVFNCFHILLLFLGSGVIFFNKINLSRNSTTWRSLVIRFWPAPQSAMILLGNLRLRLAMTRKPRMLFVHQSMSLNIHS